MSEFSERLLLAVTGPHPVISAPEGCEMSQFKYEDPDLMPRIHMKNQASRKARHSGDPLLSSLGEPGAERQPIHPSR